MKVWFLVIVVSLAGRAAAFELLANGDLEKRDEKGAFAHWKGVTVYGAPAKFGVDESVKHSGDASFKIVSTESTQTYLRSEPAVVAPGEEIELSGWVKTEKISGSENYKVLLMAELTGGDGRTEQFAQVAAKIDKSGTNDWMKVEGKVKVPGGTAVMRLRAGVFNCVGTCWWDGLHAEAKAPFAARFDLERARVTPEMGGVPVMIVNRDGRTGVVRLRVTFEKQTVERDVQLTGEAVQKVFVGMKINERGEELKLKLALMEMGDKEAIWKEEREVMVPWALVLSPPIPTHWAVEDGAAKIEGDVDVAVTKEMRERGKLVVRLLSGAKEIAKWESDQVKDGFNYFEMAGVKAGLGDYTLKAELRPRRGDVIAVEQPFGVIHRSQAKTVLNADGFLEKEGKAIFPLGIFNGGGKMKEMGEAGFTVSHTYNDADVEPGERPGDQRAMHFFMESQKAGLKVLFLIPRGLAFAHDWDGVRRRVRMFRNHPALLAWDEEEGIARDDMSPEDLAKLRQIIREEDPNHPLMVGDSRLPIQQVKDRSNFFPISSMDLGMWWWYPIPMAAQRDAGLEGEEKGASPGEMKPPSFLVLRRTTMPIWVGVQAYKKNENSRYPNPVEYRAQAYIAIIHGAKGLMWYAGSVEGGLYLAPKEGRWDYFKKLAGELNGLSDVFMGSFGETPRFEPGSAKMSVAVKVAEHRTVLLAANRSALPVDVMFHLAQPKGGSVEVLSENRRVDCVGGKIVDHFDAYGVHVYELGRK